MGYRITAHNLHTKNVLSFIMYTNKTEEEVIEYLENYGYDAIEISAYEHKNPLVGLSAEEDRFLQVLQEGGIINLFDGIEE